MWTQFWDMHSGGGLKEPPYHMIYIEAPEDEARVVFYNRFGHNPERVSCTCCGEDYSIMTEEDIKKLTDFRRRNGETVEEYFAKPDVLAIRADEIKPEERTGDVPTQGYVWAG